MTRKPNTKPPAGRKTRDLDGNEEHVTDPVVDGFAVKDGMILLTEKPGLGVDVDPAFLKTLKKI